MLLSLAIPGRYPPVSIVQDAQGWSSALSNASAIPSIVAATSMARSSARRSARRMHATSRSRAAICLAGGFHLRAMPGACSWLTSRQRKIGTARFYNCTCIHPKLTGLSGPCFPDGKADNSLLQTLPIPAPLNCALTVSSKRAFSFRWRATHRSLLWESHMPRRRNALRMQNNLAALRPSCFAEHPYSRRSTQNVRYLTIPSGRFMQ